MFAHEKLYIVIVCTHAPQHAPIAIAAAKAGLHVLCEKPLSVNLESADGMISTAQKASV